VEITAPKASTSNGEGDADSRGGGEAAGGRPVPLMAAVISFPPLVFAIRAGRVATGATGFRFGGMTSDQNLYGEGL